MESHMPLIWPYVLALLLASIEHRRWRSISSCIRDSTKRFLYGMILAGTDDLDENVVLQKQLMNLLSREQFLLRKWRFNKKEILQHLNTENKYDELLVKDQ